MGNLGKIVMVIALFALSVITGGVLTYCGWNWFGVELFPEYGAITFKTAIIFNLAKGLIFYKHTKQEEDKELSGILGDALSNLFTPYLVLLFFWIVKLIIL